MNSGYPFHGASLPRLLHGYNGRLITNPCQLDDSLDLLFGHLAEIATSEVRLIEFIRVDLVLNLPGDPRRFVLAHDNARHHPKRPGKQAAMFSPNARRKCCW